MPGWPHEANLFTHSGKLQESIADHAKPGRQWRSELLARTSIPPDYVALMVEASTSTRAAQDAVTAVDAGFADPRRGAASRRAVVEELFHRPGTATERAVGELYEVLALAAPETVPGQVTRSAFDDAAPAARIGETR